MSTDVSRDRGRWRKRLAAMGWMACASVAVTWAPLAAADYPERPIRLISPFAAGGTTDILARLVGKEMFPDAGQTVVVENVPGAGGTIGAAQVARAAPDGYTLELGGVSTHAMASALYGKLPFDPVDGFEAVAMLVNATMAIAVPASAPFQDLTGLMAYARAHPGALAYGSGGVGSINHLAMAAFEKAAGIEMLHVPYKGGGPAVNAVLQNEVQLVAAGTSLLLPHVQSGKVRLLAVTDAQRSRLLPDVPAVAEHLPGFRVGNWYGILAPKGLPASLRQTLWTELDRVMRLPALTEKLDTMGLEYPGLTADGFADLLKADQQYWPTLIREVGIQPH